VTNMWETVSLGEVVEHRKEFIEIDDLKKYKRCRVQIHAKGIVLRDEVEGSIIKTKKQQVCREDEFLVAEIDAKVGGYGIVPSDLEGAIVSSHYFLFNSDCSKLDPNFLGFFIKTPMFKEQVAARGSTNYAAIRPHHVLDYKIPLPPLSEQHRIVRKIANISMKVIEAKGHHNHSSQNLEAFYTSCRAKAIQDALLKGSKLFADAATLERGKFSHRPRNDQRFFGGTHPWIQIGEIESANKYIKKWSITLNDEGLAISRKFPKGTVLVSIAATIGSVGILDFDCCIPDSIVAITPHDGIDSEFVYHYLGHLRTHLESVAPQSAQKNINLKILSVLPFPDISLSEQGRIVDDLNTLQIKVDSIKNKQSKIKAELDALMPSILDKAFKGEL